MNDLIFYALLVALIYYFFIYLPNQKKLSSSNQSLPTVNTQGTQTEETTETITRIEEPGMVNCPSIKSIPNPPAIKKLTQENTELQKDNQQKEQTIIGLNRSYEKLATKSETQIKELKEQLTEKEQQLEELKVSEKNLDEMLKEITELNKEITE